LDIFSVQDSIASVSISAHLTPLLTPLRAQHAETVGNHEQRILLTYADSATYGNG
jgi:hypothetical protein